MSEHEETLQIYTSEAEDLLKSAEACLMSLESAPDPIPGIQELFRSLHTIKSSAAMVGFALTSEHAHLLENLADRVRARKLVITKGLVTFLLDSIDFLRSMVERSCGGEAEAELADLKRHRDQAAYFLGLEESAPPAAPPLDIRQERGVIGTLNEHTFQIDLGFRTDVLLSGRDPLPLLLNLSQLGELVQVLPDTTRIPHFDELSPNDLHISWQVILRTSRSREDVEEVFSFVRSDNTIRIEDVSTRFGDGAGRDADDKKPGPEDRDRESFEQYKVPAATGLQWEQGKILADDDKLRGAFLKEAPSLQNEGRADYRRTTVRVGVEKIDHLLALAEEMGVGLAKMQALLSGLRGPRNNEINEQLDDLLNVNREFRDSVTRIRMFPLEGTFGRLQRLVRDLAFRQNKSITVKVSGGDTELDKDVIEVITDPLKHILRNCVDHGIEPSVERIARGKSADGVIEMKAWQRGGRVFIEIGDDGRGIDLEAVRKTASEGGWLPKEQPAGREELLDLIFRSGFSTRSSVTELSGRGVGMDVARKNLEQLGGSIVVQTEKDKGTVFTMILPHRFSLMEVLHVRVSGDHSYLLPLQAVLATEKTQEGLCRSLGGDGKLYKFRGDFVPVVELAEVLGLAGPAGGDRASVVVFVDSGQKVFGLHVDEVVESLQVIIKTLEVNYRRVKGLAGVALMADGIVSLVIDLPGLEELCFKSS